MSRAFVALLTAMAIAMATPLEAQRQTTATVDAVTQWANSVNGHTPGRPDSALQGLRAMTYQQRRDLNASYPLFIRALRGDRRVVAGTDLDRAVIALGAAMRVTPGREAFLHRAAVLHADAVVFADLYPRSPDDAPLALRNTQTINGRRESSSVQPPPLLTNERVVLTRDGEVVGDTPLDWNLPFGRSLLQELLQPDTDAPPDFAFVGEWYHAVAACLFANGMNGDATSHLREAQRVLPDDPRLLFDRGTYAEAFGLPIYQAVQQQAPSGRIVANLPSEEKTNGEAERLYRRALEIDPAYIEARVRVSRLLDRRGRHDEAAVEIDKALSASPKGVVGYYAQIMAGRIAAARGHYDEALRHYRQASSLFPGAQSALLGASHASLMLSDVSAALAPLGQLQGAGDDSDPWWDYQLGAGRDVNALLAALWAGVLK